MPSAYVPPHIARRRDRESTKGAGSPPWASLESLVTPDDSVSVVAGRATMPLTELNEGDVACLLHSLGLGRYADVCMVLPLRGRDLAHCTEDDLKEIGIRFRPHRLSLLEEVAALRANGVPAHMLLEPSPQQQQQLLSSGDGGGSADVDPSETPTWIKSALQALPQRQTSAGDNCSAAAPSETPTWIKSAEAHVRTLPTQGGAQSGLRGPERGGAPPLAATALFAAADRSLPVPIPPPTSAELLEIALAPKPVEAGQPGRDGLLAVPQLATPGF